LQINELQLEGKKRMSASAFLAGFPVEDWELIFD
jgi:methionyl-tRNA formyltransferase